MKSVIQWVGGHQRKLHVQGKAAFFDQTTGKSGINSAKTSEMKESCEVSTLTAMEATLDLCSHVYLIPDLGSLYRE